MIKPVDLNLIFRSDITEFVWKNKTNEDDLVRECYFQNKGKRVRVKKEPSKYGMYHLEIEETEETEETEDGESFFKPLGHFGYLENWNSHRMGKSDEYTLIEGSLYFTMVKEVQNLYVIYNTGARYLNKGVSVNFFSEKINIWIAAFSKETLFHVREMMEFFQEIFQEESYGRPDLTESKSFDRTIMVNGIYLNLALTIKGLVLVQIEKEDSTVKVGYYQLKKDKLEIEAIYSEDHLWDINVTPDEDIFNFYLKTRLFTAFLKHFNQ